MALTDNLLLKQMVIGPAENFIYFIGDAQSGEVAVVDPAWDVERLLNLAHDQNLKITAALLTHGHMDHINGVEELTAAFDGPVYVSREEAPYYLPNCKNLIKTKPGQILTIGSVKITCLHTPGHSPGCQCFLSGKHLLTGDTLFIDGCGRCDLPGGDPQAMYDSLYDILLKLPEDTILYPGHRYGPADQASLASQKKTNPYLQCTNKQEFLTTRMGY